MDNLSHNKTKNHIKICIFSLLICSAIQYKIMKKDIANCYQLLVFVLIKMKYKFVGNVVAVRLVNLLHLHFLKNYLQYTMREGVKNSTFCWREGGRTPVRKRGQKVDVFSPAKKDRRETVQKQKLLVFKCSQRLRGFQCFRTFLQKVDFLSLP